MVPAPSGCRSGTHNTSTMIPETIVTVPKLMPRCFTSPSCSTFQGSRPRRASTIKAIANAATTRPAASCSQRRANRPARSCCQKLRIGRR